MNWSSVSCIFGMALTIIRSSDPQSKAGFQPIQIHIPVFFSRLCIVRQIFNHFARSHRQPPRTGSRNTSSVFDKSTWVALIDSWESANAQVCLKRIPRRKLQSLKIFIAASSCDLIIIIIILFFAQIQNWTTIIHWEYRSANGVRQKQGCLFEVWLLTVY